MSLTDNLTEGLMFLSTWCVGIKYFPYKLSKIINLSISFFILSWLIHVRSDLRFLYVTVTICSLWECAFLPFRLPLYVFSSFSFFYFVASYQLHCFLYSRILTYFFFAFIPLEMHAMIRVSHSVPCPIVFILFHDLGWQAGVLKFWKRLSFKYF